MSDSNDTCDTCWALSDECKCTPFDKRCAHCNKARGDNEYQLSDGDVAWMADILYRKHESEHTTNEFTKIGIREVKDNVRAFLFCSQDCADTAITICRLSSGIG